MSSLVLVVLRAGDVDATLASYRGLGLAFVAERHGAGTPHHACTLPGGLVLEVYPAAGEGEPAARARGVTSLGLKVPLDETVAALRALGATVVREPRAGARRRAVVLDPDGRSVELVDLTTLGP